MFVEHYISTRQSPQLSAIGSEEQLREQDFSKQQFCKQPENLCVSYLVSAPLATAQTLSYEVEIEADGRTDRVRLALDRRKSLRLRADYTGAQVDRPTAERTVARAEEFVRTVEHAFDLEALRKTTDLGLHAPENLSPDRQAASSTDPSEVTTNSPGLRVSVEEMRREAAENWRRTYYDSRGREGGTQPAPDANDRSEHEKRDSGKDRGLEFDPER